MWIAWARIIVVTLFVLPSQAFGQGGVERDREGVFVAWEVPVVLVPEDIDKANVISSIQLALVMRSWRTIEHNQQAQYFDVELPVRTHVARLRVDYGDDGSVRFLHREGDNLPIAWFVPRYSPTTGERLSDELVRSSRSSHARLAVHQNYDDWVHQLVRTVTGLFQLPWLEIGPAR